MVPLFDIRVGDPFDEPHPELAVPVPAITAVVPSHRPADKSATTEPGGVTILERCLNAGEDLTEQVRDPVLAH
jgi:hypothetical protein